MLPLIGQDGHLLSGCSGGEEGKDGRVALKRQHPETLGTGVKVPPGWRLPDSFFFLLLRSTLSYAIKWVWGRATIISIISNVMFPRRMTDGREERGGGKTHYSLRHVEKEEEDLGWPAKDDGASHHRFPLYCTSM